MGNLIRLSRFFVVMLWMVFGIHSLQAQLLPYEIVTVNGQSCYKYRVKSGEGLYSVSRIFSVPVAEILRHNPGSNSGLQSGQELLIPIIGATQGDLPVPAQSGDSQLHPATDQNNTFTHTVVKGETVYSISRMYHTTVDQINRLNPGAAEGIAEGAILTIPQRRVLSEEKEKNYRYHTILPKETLYSVSRTYHLKPEDVVRANPGLSAETFQIGKTIRIPFFESYEVVMPFEKQTTHIMHTVARGETLYSIAGKYGVTVSDIEQKNPMLSGGLKANMELIVPVQRSKVEGVNPSLEKEANNLLSQQRPSQRVDVMKVGLLLPFLDQTSRGHLRLQEYYEGFLLAVEELKNNGANLELYVFEIGKGNDIGKLESLLGTLEIQSLNLIIGGVSDVQIKLLSDFSRSHNIQYVVPFSQSNGEVFSNGNMFQVNPLTSITHTKAVSFFVRKFRNANIFFVNGGYNDENEFIFELQSALKKKNLPFGSIGDAATLSSSIMPLLRREKENVIVPVSSDAGTLRQIINELKKLHESNPEFATPLFGYPDWQTYSNLTDEYHLFGTYFYTPFFADEQAAETKRFNESFRRWYGRNPMETYPGYGMWGYDTGLFFLTALQRYGLHFEQHVDRVTVPSLLFPFRFERLNNWGGLINGGLYIIHYDTDGKIHKIDQSR